MTIMNKKLALSKFSSKPFIVSLLVGSLSGGIFLWQRKLLNSSYEIISSDSNYIYLPVGQHGSENFPTSLQEFGSPEYVHWKLLKLAKSNNTKIRKTAISSLTETKYFSDAVCREIAQACDFATSVELSRSKGIDSRYFLPSPKGSPEIIQDELRISLCKLLSCLPKSDKQSCVQYLTQLALSNVIYDLEETVERLTDGDENVRGRNRISKNSSLRLCLEALCKHSEIKEHCVPMVILGVFQILQKALDGDNHKNIVAQILSNITVELQTHKHIFISGWLGILSKWMNCGNLELELLAGQALANLASEGQKAMYDNGVYLLHPLDRETDHSCILKMDIVFVHGLLGGAFRTWRQHDGMRDTPKFLDDGILLEKTNYTQCWPKYWLSEDLKDIRVLALDYESSLSDWTNKCPFEKQKRSISARSEEFLTKLSLAKLGERPIVWVTHSMGGLLVKELLIRSKDHPDAKIRKLSENTRGVVFYSVPHRGSNIKLNSITLPSVELQNINDLEKLKCLDESFASLVQERNIECLSFGESLKTSLGMKWSLHLVPPQSANLGYGSFHLVDVDHLNICKPKDKSCLVYDLLLRFIQEQMSRASSDIEGHSVQDDVIKDLLGASCLSL